MKVPSLFKIPSYQRFKIVPRHYDPIKEDIEQRTAQIKNELSGDEADLTGRSSRLVGAFRTNKSKPGGSASLMQFIIMLLLAFMIFGYIYLGTIALYVFVTTSAILLFLKMKRII